MGYHKTHGNAAKNWMLLAVAARLSYALHLNISSKYTSPTEIECHKRMTWNLHIQDTFMSGSIDEFSLCFRFLEDLPLPCDEQSFLSERSSQPQTTKGDKPVKSTANISCFAYIIQILDIWTRVHR